ncbi:MAG: Uma2 family endonuclease, partial [Polyangiaceae bacterium]|nr:Uma2 family endonuclease [Polyangiaceae bacterium]
APGLLKNPVPVEALWDRDAAHAATLRNLLHREGVESLHALREEGREEGACQASRATLLQVLDARGLAISGVDRARVAATTDLAQLGRWIARAAVATSIEAVFS